MSDVGSTMEEGIGDDLPDMKIHVPFDGRHRPQIQQFVEAVARRGVQQIHLQQINHHIGGDPDLDGTCVDHAVF
jgi:hypothetical protein